MKGDAKKEDANSRQANQVSRVVGILEFSARLIGVRA